MADSSTDPRIDYEPIIKQNVNKTSNFKKMKLALLLLLPAAAVTTTSAAAAAASPLTYIQIQCFDSKCNQDCDGGAIPQDTCIGSAVRPSSTALTRLTCSKSSGTTATAVVLLQTSLLSCCPSVRNPPSESTLKICVVRRTTSVRSALVQGGRTRRSRQ